MRFEVNQEVQFFGRIDQVNVSTYDSYACNVTCEDGDKVIVRIPESAEVLLNKIYYFETIAVLFKDRLHLQASRYSPISTMDLAEEVKVRLMRAFYAYAPMDVPEARKSIEETIASLQDPDIKAITEAVYRKYANDFYLYPAATKFHHAYISGLAYHTWSMLKLADGFLRVYPFLNSDLVYAGIILHDVTKVLEFDSYEGSEYTIKGRLIGHITLGTNEIALTAKELGLESSEACLMLEHIILSHHYYGNFGSPKKPNTAEALVIHFIDNVDSKVCVLGEELEKTQTGDFTQPIGVLDKERYYKHKYSK
ncbi:MAG TPA: HD domain-containing protein [Candidatus Izemoplasmatales bacterium]|nr:HD domain-containing protein [Bacillota bacterium]HRY77937.1 HD domain-containing protein [Candidatus Izemoplasmatales bacterium]